MIDPGLKMRPGVNILMMPFELREKIYLYHFQDDRIYTIIPSFGNRIVSASELDARPELLLTCRQICDEGRPIYAQTLVVRHSCMDKAEWFRAVAERMPPFIRAHLRTVSLTLTQGYLTLSTLPQLMSTTYPNLRVIELSIRWSHGVLRNRDKPMAELNDEAIINELRLDNTGFAHSRVKYDPRALQQIPHIAVFISMATDIEVSPLSFCSICHPYRFLHIEIMLNTLRVTRNFTNRLDKGTAQKEFLGETPQPLSVRRPVKNSSCRRPDEHVEHNDYYDPNDPFF